MVYVIRRKDEGKRLEDRTELLKAHARGKLPKSYYSEDKKTGKPYLSPKRLYKDGY